jgi:hypothetical protein
MLVNSVSRKTRCRFGDRLAYRELLIALSIIKIAVLRLKTEFSSTWPVVLVGLEAKSVEGLKDGRITRAKKFSQRNSVISGPRPTGNALGH